MLPDTSFLKETSFSVLILLPKIQFRGKMPAVWPSWSPSNSVLHSKEASCHYQKHKSCNTRSFPQCSFGQELAEGAGVKSVWVKSRWHNLVGKVGSSFCICSSHSCARNLSCLLLVSCLQLNSAGKFLECVKPAYVSGRHRGQRSSPAGLGQGHPFGPYLHIPCVLGSLCLFLMQECCAAIKNCPDSCPE